MYIKCTYTTSHSTHSLTHAQNTHASYSDSHDMTHTTLYTDKQYVACTCHMMWGRNGALHRLWVGVSDTVHTWALSHCVSVYIYAALSQSQLSTLTLCNSDKNCWTTNHSTKVVSIPYRGVEAFDPLYTVYILCTHILCWNVFSWIWIVLPGPSWIWIVLPGPSWIWIVWPGFH